MRRDSRSATLDGSGVGPGQHRHDGGYRHLKAFASVYYPYYLTAVGIGAILSVAYIRCFGLAAVAVAVD